MKPALLILLLAFPRLLYAQGTTQVPLTFSGGHETEGRDRGRPVVLVAAGLGVPPEVFREAFSHVKPAGPGEQPEEAQVRKNKQALMAALGPYGVTDDRLNEVSNWYRYRRESGDLWKHVDAAGYATVTDGKVTAMVLTNPGAGYTTPPMVTIAGMPQVTLTARLWFGTDLARNGSIQDVRTAAAP